MSPVPGKVASHDLAPPTLADCRTAIDRAARGDSTVWAQLCREANVSPTATATDLAGLERIVNAAKSREGGVKIAAMSIGVRLTTFRTLTTLNARSA